MAEHKIGQNNLQKNIHSHHPLPAGHQAQHGGVRLHGLSIGKNGTSTVGRTTNGQNNVE